MSEGCTHDCSTCGENCSERKAEDMKLRQNDYSNIKKVIAVVSGKGGVGKSLVTSLLASASQARGFETAVMDADVTIKIMSINLLLEKEDAPVVWRGPVISGVINQFWQEVLWGDVDYMFVDMPPGTGDVPLTVFQSLPVDGIIIVTTPQDLVTMIVKKAYNMAKMMNVPIIGLVENMSYFECPDCKKKYNIFGESKIDEVAKELGVPVLARLPIDPKTASLVDKGAVELCDDKAIAPIIDKLPK